MMTARRFQCLWILLFATTLATPACYTLLKHPRVDMTVYEETPDSRCASCHSEDELFAILLPPTHPLPPPDDPILPPWWWEPWEEDPPGPSALRGFRPGGNEPNGPIILGPGPINPPPGPKVIGGDVRVRDPDDKKGEKHDEEIRDDRGKGGGGNGSNDSKDKDRPVRPTGKKGKEDG
jgi:hypothetical protein